MDEANQTNHCCISVILYHRILCYQLKVTPIKPINWGLKKSANGVPAEAGKAWDDLLAETWSFL